MIPFIIYDCRCLVGFSLAHYVWRLGEGGDFQHPDMSGLMRRNKLLLITKQSYKAPSLPLAKTAVTGWFSVGCLCKPLSVLSFCVIVLSAVRCFFIFFEDLEIF
jgi:hypothetical protein